MDNIDSSQQEFKEELGKQLGDQASTEQKIPEEKDPGDIKTLNVDGSQKTFTEDEITTAAQKWFAGDDRLKKAAEEKRHVEQLQEEGYKTKQMAADIAAAQQGDTNAILRLPQYEQLGITQEAAVAVVQRMKEMKATGGKDEEPTVEQYLSQEMEELKSEVETLRTEKQEQEQKVKMQKLFVNTGKQLEQDPIVGYLSKENPKAFNHLSGVALKALIRMTNQEGRPYNADTLKSATVEARQYAEELGIVQSQDNSIPTGNSASLPGLGHSPLALSASNIARRKEAPKPTENVLDTGDYAKNINERLLYEMFNGDSG